jgi:hypothetical protein
MSTSRWLTWTPPNSRVIRRFPEHEPPKPPKTGFEGSAGTSPGNFQENGTKPVAGERAFQRREFPHCPKCAGYSLYRKNNVGSYECMTCGLQDISEEVARRVQ